jgi:anti-anti-sigma factor
MGRRDTGFATATRRVGDFLIVSLDGELDMATAPEFEREIERAQGGSAIVVDLRGLTFIDSTGIRALMRVYSAGQNGHSTVSFIRGPSRIQRVLDLAGVEPLLVWSEPPAEFATDAI